MTSRTINVKEVLESDRINLRADVDFLLKDTKKDEAVVLDMKGIVFISRPARHQLVTSKIPCQSIEVINYGKELVCSVLFSKPCPKCKQQVVFDSGKSRCMNCDIEVKKDG